MKGIDLSSNQRKPDFQKIKEEGIEFAILRISTRNGKVDTSFEYNYEQCQRNGILTGIYKFSYATNEQEARAEAENVLLILNSRKLMMPVWLDLEWSGQRNLGQRAITKIAHTFAEKIKSAGYACGIYCNLDWYRNVLDTKELSYPYWVARYGKNDGGCHIEYQPKVGEVIWQYTSRGDINGIAGEVDRNLCLDSTIFQTYPNTEQTGDDWISRLQKALNVPVTGLPDAKTLSTLPTIRRGDRGEVVRLIQERLQSLGYDPKGIDGVYGLPPHHGMYDAVRNFQEEIVHIQPDGVLNAGMYTWKKLLGL